MSSWRRNKALPPVSFQNRCRAAGVHRSVEGRLDQAAGARLGQRLEIEPGEQAVLPQRRHRVGFGLAGAHRDDQPRPARLRKLMYDVCRQPVQQVCVIDADQHPALTLLCDKGIDEAAHIGHRLRSGFGDRPGERAERQRPGGLGAGDPVRPLACGLRTGTALLERVGSCRRPAAPQITTPE